MNKLPNFDSVPSCMSHQEVTVLISSIMDIAESKCSYSIDDIEACLNEAIFALLYEPNEEIDIHVSQRVLAWVSHNWDSGSNAFLDGACTILVNIHPNGVHDFLSEKRKTEKRDKALVCITEALSELRT